MRGSSKTFFDNKYIEGLVSVIIVNWNGKHYLEGCLQTLFSQTYELIEVILVDNASSDGSIEFVKSKFPKVQVLENKKNLGFAVGNNIGYKYCNGEYIFMLNNDTELPPCTVEKLVNALKEKNIAGACGKMYSLNDRNKCIFTLPKINSLTGKAVWINDDSPTRTVDYLTGCCMILKRKLIDKIGFLDSTYFAYFEETDLCARLIRAGYDLLYVADAFVWHKEMGSTPSWFNRYYMMRNQIRFIIKNFDLKYIPFALIVNIKPVIKALIKRRNKDELIITSVESKSKPYNLKCLIFKGLLWNIVFFPHTLYCRIRDINKIGSKIRSYNENLPLREIKNDI